LKIETQPRDDHQVTLIVEIEAERMEGAKHRAARRISERKSIPGFRPGKAPYDVVVRSFGEGVISEEAIDLLLDDVYPEALKEAKLDPSGPGKVEKVDNPDAPKITFVVPLMPGVELGKYRSIRLPYDWQAPSDDRVETEIDELRRIYSSTQTVERPVEKGDFVLLDIKGVKAGAKEGETPVVERPGYPVFVRLDEKADEWPYAGFSNELIGLKAEESKSFKHKYDENFSDEQLHGLTVNFEVTVKTVRGVILPELNDEFAKKVGSFANLQALRDAVSANLAVQSRTEYDNDYFVRLIEKIKEGATIKYPPHMLDHEVEHVVEDITARLVEQGLDLDTYLKSRQMDREKYVAEEARPVAARRLERSLILDEIARLEKIEVNDETLNAAFQQTWGEVKGNPGFQKTMRGKSQPPKRVLDAVAMESAGRALTQQTLQRLKDIATGQAPALVSERKKPSVSKAKKAAGKKSAGTKTAKTASRTKKPATGAKKSPARPAAIIPSTILSPQGKKTTKKES
jgi:trigger factor